MTNSATNISVAAAQEHVTPRTDLPHRQDIDGLRAVAVLLVVFEHMGFRFARGGFIGVDVFFVISGYLITGNILRGLHSGKFTVRDFYDRRFRRITPALVVMLTFVALVAYAILLPAHLVAFGRTLIAAVLCFSNINFAFLKVGYFDSNYANLLLHTWSLGVEEQFYLVIPIALVVIHRLKRSPNILLVPLAILSFGWAAWKVRSDVGTVFYMPQARGWELLCGSLLSTGFFSALSNRVLRTLAGLLSLLGLAAFSWFYVPAIPFPGASALVPCLAAVGLISAGTQPDNPVSRLLATQPMPFIGAISYSLYLWHWPIILLVRLGLVPGITDGALTGETFILATSLSVATLSWWFVERPFRFGAFRQVSPAQIFSFVAVTAILLVTVGTTLIHQDGFPSRYPEHSLRIADELDAPHQMREGSCFISSGNAYDPKLCLAEDPQRHNVLLFGDSHAAALWIGLKQNFPDVNFLQVTGSTCHPTFGNYRGSACSHIRKQFFQQDFDKLHLDAAILTERWGSGQDPFDLLSAVDFFQRHRVPVYVIGPAPEYSAPLPILLAIGDKLKNPALAERSRSRGFDSLDRKLASRIESLPGVHYVSLLQVLCNRDGCRTFTDDAGTMPMLQDIDHFSVEGSIQVVSRLKKQGKLPV